MPSQSVCYGVVAKDNPKPEESNIWLDEKKQEKFMVTTSDNQRKQVLSFLIPPWSFCSNVQEYSPVVSHLIDRKPARS